MANAVKNHPDSGTVIGRGSMLEGALQIDHCVRVEGCLRGRLTTTDVLIVSAQGTVIAESMEVGEAYIGGRVWGQLKASRQVYLTATSEFHGSVETPHLAMEEGAIADFCPPHDMVAVPDGWEEDPNQAKTTLREFPAGGETADGAPPGTTPEGELAGGD